MVRTWMRDVDGRRMDVDLFNASIRCGWRGCPQHL